MRLSRRDRGEQCRRGGADLERDGACEVGRHVLECIVDISDPDVDPDEISSVVTVDWDDSTGANLTAYLSKSAHECPQGADIGVRTFTFTAGRPYKPSNNVAFTILVP